MILRERQRYAIRKLSVGAASVLLGTTMFLTTNSHTAHAADIDDSETDSNIQTSTVDNETKTINTDTNTQNVANTTTNVNATNQTTNDDSGANTTTNDENVVNSTATTDTNTRNATNTTTNVNATTNDATSYNSVTSESADNTQYTTYNINDEVATTNTNNINAQAYGTNTQQMHVNGDTFELEPVSTSNLAENKDTYTTPTITPSNPVYNGKDYTDDLQKTVNFHLHAYLKNDDGSVGKEVGQYNKSVTWFRSATVESDGSINFGNYMSDEDGKTFQIDPIKGYTVDTNSVKIPTLTPNSPTDQTINVYYVPAQPTLTVKYVDESDNNKVLTTDTKKGHPGDFINDYDYWPIISTYVDKGYVEDQDKNPFRANNYPEFPEDGSNLTLTIYLKHDTETTSNGPDNNKTVKRTIHYTGAGNATPQDKVQTASFHRTTTKDKVTGKVISQTPWSGSQTLGEVISPTVANYKPDKAKVDAATVSATSTDSTVTVNYELDQITTNSDVSVTQTIKYVDDNGKAMPNIPNNVQTLNFTKTEVKDGTGKVLSTKYTPKNGNQTQAVTTPKVTHYTPDKASVGANTLDPAKGNQTITVTYHQMQTAHVHFVNDDDKVDLAVKDLWGDSNTKSDYTTKDKIAEYAKGTGDNAAGKVYQVVSDDTHGNPITFDNDLSKDQNFYVHLKRVDPNADNVTSKRTINYVDENGKKLHEPTVQTQTGKKGGKVTFPSNPNPVINGYTTNSATPPDTVDAGSDKTITVTYKANGKIVPVDSNGNKIPNAPTPQYTTDPNNPNKVTPNEKVPTVPGYTPKQSTVTPTDPTKDTNVTYVKNAPDTANSTVTIKYVDGNGKSIHADTTQTKSGNKGSNIDFGNIKNPVINGYVAPNTSTSIGNIPAGNNKTITVTYKSVGKIIPVTPDGNKIPNAPTPQYNNDPNDPTKVTVTTPPTIANKTPQKSSVTPPTDPSKDTPLIYNDNSSQFTRTIHYVGAGDKTPKDVVQTVTVSPNSPKSFNSVETPVINGYTADKAKVDSENATKNETITVTYKATGHIIPVDSNGNKIPNAPTPQYNNDPNDPTKTTTTTPPIVPGYTASVPNVNPTDPSKDTPVKYTKDQPTKPSDATTHIEIHFIDRTQKDDKGNPGKLLESHDITDKVGTKITWDAQPTINKLLQEGYKLISNGYNVYGQTLTASQNDYHYDIVFDHATKIVKGHDKNPKTGKDVNLAYDKIVTTHYQWDEIGGSSVMPDRTQTIPYEASATVDLVTGELSNISNYTTTAKIDKSVPHVDNAQGHIARDTDSDRKEEIWDVYTKNNFTGEIDIIDQPTGKVLKKVPVTGTAGTPIKYPDNDVNPYLDKYKTDKNSWGSPTLDSNGKILKIELQHQTKSNDRTKTITQTISYVKDDGSKAFDDNVQTFTFTQKGTLDLVTGQTTYDDKDTNWTKTQTTKAVTSPELDGYTPNMPSVNAMAIKSGDNNTNIKVVYKKNAPDTANAKVLFYDKTDGKLLAQKDLTGAIGSSTGYNTKSDLANFSKLHYIVASDETNGNDVVINANGSNTYKVYLTHATADATRTKTVKRTIHYVVPNGYNAPIDVTQVLTFTDHGVRDLVTNKVTWDSDKKQLVQNFSRVASPKLAGLKTPEDAHELAIELSSKNWDEDLDSTVVREYALDNDANNKKSNDNNGDDGDKTHKPSYVSQNTDDGKHTNGEGAGNGNNANNNDDGNNGANTGNNNNSGNANNTNAKDNTNAKGDADTSNNDAGSSALPQTAKAATVNTLPQTGNGDSDEVLAGIGAILAGIGTIGMTILKRKRENE